MSDKLLLAMQKGKGQQDERKSLPPECLPKLIEILDDLGKLVFEARNVLFEDLTRKHKESEKARMTEIVSSGLILNLGNAVRTVLVLSSCRDLWGLMIAGRAAFETVLNLAYILASGEEVADRAVTHAMEKQKRDQERHLEIGGLIIRDTSRQLLIAKRKQKYSEVKAEYKRHGEREKRSWTDANVVERIEEIKRVYGDRVAMRFMMSLMVTYRYGSEVLHGTFFSTLWLSGMLEDPAREVVSHDLQGYRIDNCALMVLTVANLVYLAMEVLAKEYADVAPVAKKCHTRLGEFQLPPNP